MRAGHSSDFQTHLKVQADSYSGVYIEYEPVHTRLGYGLTLPHSFYQMNDSAADWCRGHDQWRWVGFVGV